MKSSLTIIKIVLTVASVVSIGTALGTTVYFGVLKNNPPVAVQPTITPTITSSLTPTATLTLIPTVTPNNIDTSDWKTYRNEKFGYEIKYPKDWKLIYLSDLYPGNTSISLRSPGYQSIKDENVIFDGEVYVSVIDNPSNLSIKDLFNTFNDTGRFWFAKYDHKDITINGNHGVLFDNVAEDTVSNIKRTSVYIQGEKKVIDVSYLFLENPNREIYDKILSTFKFTN